MLTINDAPPASPTPEPVAAVRRAPARPMNWGDWLAERLSPGFFSGMGLGTWLQVLWDNGFAIDPPYWPRAALITLASVPNSLTAALESFAFGPAVRRARIAPPLFVLGLPRSGTTHLHNLLARDDRFSFPNSFEMLFPHTFLAADFLLRRLVGRLMTPTRPQDAVKSGIDEPQEDEWAFPAMMGQSPLLGSAFPRQADRHQRYLTLRDVGEHQRERWKQALRALVQKLSYRHGGRPLVLKSPGHTGRIGLLLDLFPDARFVHIRRNPYDVYQSAVDATIKGTPSGTFQRCELGRVGEQTLRTYGELTAAYLEQRGRIPTGRLYELRYEDLEVDPVGELRAMYGALSLPDFRAFEPALTRYLATLKGYRRNHFARLSADERERIAEEWKCQFEEFGYPRD